jgi:hypothetical protein
MMFNELENIIEHYIYSIIAYYFHIIFLMSKTTISGVATL